MRSENNMYVAVETLKKLRQREKRFLETYKLLSFISASGSTDFSVLEAVSETAVLLNQKKQLISNATR